MKITNKELLAKHKDRINFIILNSITTEVYDTVDTDAEVMNFDVKLVINGVDCPVNVLESIYDNVEAYIKEEARNIVNNTLNKAQEDAEELAESVKNISDSISDKFSIFLEEEY